MKPLYCIVVTPESTSLETEVEFAALPLYDGEIGIASGHSPMIGRLGYGEMRLRNKGKTSSYYIDGGFVQIDDNTISVLTNRATQADQIDASAAQELLDSAMKRPANSPELLEIRDRTVAQARAQIRIARRQS